MGYIADIDGILPKGLYPPSLRMADRALLADTLDMKAIRSNCML